MPKTGFTILIFVILGLTGVIYFFDKKQHRLPPDQWPQQGKSSAYFFPVHIEKFTSTRMPCIKIKIEEKEYSFGLDLGFRGHLSMNYHSLEQISNKSFVSVRSMYGFKGNEHRVSVYKIPKVKIGKISFLDPLVQEENRDSKNESTIIKTGYRRSPSVINGKLGWELFGSMNLFLDMKNSIIAFCDGIETLMNQRCSATSFVNLPLLLDQGMIEFETTTSTGPLRCVLDTGCTFNFINTIDSDVWNHIKKESFRIGKQEFGEITFHPLPIHLPIHVEAALGMEFLFQHQVFIDFRTKQIYISHP